MSLLVHENGANDNFYFFSLFIIQQFVEQKRNLYFDKGKAGMSKSETQQEGDCMKNKSLN